MARTPPQACARCSMVDGINQKSGGSNGYCFRKGGFGDWVGRGDRPRNSAEIRRRGNNQSRKSGRLRKSDLDDREVESNISKNQVGQAIAEHEEMISHCLHCDSHKLNRWGVTKQGIQRFKCKSCNKTFNALADSPLYRMKKSEKWIEYTKLMWEGVSLRKSAKALNITLRTSFRWRHIFIKAPASFEPSSLTGVIEADETFILANYNNDVVIEGRYKIGDLFVDGHFVSPSKVAVDVNKIVATTGYTGVTDKPILDLTNLTIPAPAQLVGNIYWLQSDTLATITADVALPDGDYMIMAERVVDGDRVVDDVRFKATVTSGALTMPVSFPVAGNYLISAKRLNEGLDRIGSPVHLGFDDVEFDIYV